MRIFLSKNKIEEEKEDSSSANRTKMYYSLEPQKKCKATISWIFLPALLILMNLCIILLYIHYGIVDDMEQFYIFSFIVFFSWVAFWSAIPSKNNKKRDFIVVVGMGLFLIVSGFYSVIDANMILFISSMLIVFNMVIFIETIKPIILIAASKDMQCFLFGEKHKFILIMELQK